jgi:mono/diheme cytochrome c family protein
MQLVWGFLFAVVVMAGGALAVTYTGAYNVAANVPDSAVAKWLLSTNMKQSVAGQAQSVSAPPRLTEEQAREGARLYKDTCVYCHGAPGKDPGSIGKGLNPQAVYLPDAVKRWNDAELFWIIRNGIKMTGMASYGAAHSNEEIWALVAFVRRLPNMTPEQYDQMEQASAQR